MEVMIDIETMSQRKTAAILSIGAVKFDAEKIYDTFYVNVEPMSCKEIGLHFQKETIEWWSKQSKAARDALKVDQKPIKEALEMFAEWYGAYSMPTWSNGATFDIVIVENAYFAAGMQDKLPWKWQHERCFRTMKNLFKYEATENTGVAHNALDDAKLQTLILQKIYNS